MKMITGVIANKDNKLDLSQMIDGDTLAKKHKPIYGSLLPNIYPPLRLSARESECLKLCASGLTTKQIAQKIALKETTIQTYLKKVRQKLHCQTIAHAVSEGIKRGFI